MQWVGAIMDKPIEDLICHRVQISPAIGIMECRPYLTRCCDDLADLAGWQYYWFCKGQDIDFLSVCG